VELLKVRFGEQAFSMCDVMIKDMQVPLSASHVTLFAQVLSSEFWPKDLLGLVEEGAATLHPTLQQVADAFTEQVSFARVARFSSKVKWFCSIIC
jgi:hypothetical protein